MSSNPLPVDIIGYGGIAQQVAAELGRRPVTAFSRQFSGKKAPDSLACITVDLDQPSDRLEQQLHNGVWVYSAPPAGSGATDQRLAAFLKAAAKARPRAIIYLGTTGVYGNTDGDWVDEHSPTRPGNERSQRRLDAEQQWIAFARRQTCNLYLLRIGGIYASDRLPVERLKNGKPVICDHEAPWSNRIHADDLTTVIVRLIERAEQHPAQTPEMEVFNLTDNKPDKPSTLYQLTAAYHHLPMPPSVGVETALANASPMAAEFLRESRRVDAGKIQRFLGWQPRYPHLEHFFNQLEKQQQAKPA